ncbi:hypothetical protein J2X11_000466 [Aeromicrobium panaciterrae]|uniref:Uncharacterized protein n=1 Tax=Aeromicrobium panaciterrae TaxID=363861 RepID=A0ABU1UKD3_9ACTN|nr:hypothetical protein [Aeromicrobium panaciterrae]MDR7085627.1 hypothetical protein [Aeromicrobium panaciterrae]
MRKSTVILTAAIMALATVVSMSPAQAAAYQVTASISTVSAQSGDGPYFTGAISPGTPGKTVYLQRYYSGGWHTEATTSTDSDGDFAGLVSSEDLGFKVGSMKFRAKVIGSGSYTSGASSSITKTIYGWQSLAYMDAIYGDSRRYFDGNDEFTVDETTADDSWQIKDPQVGVIGTRYTKWDLQKKCIKLQGFAGIDDFDSVPGAEGRFIISMDGTAHDTGENYVLGDIRHLEEPLYNTQYLALKAYKNNGNATTIGVGEPEVLCSKKLPENF